MDSKRGRNMSKADFQDYQVMTDPLRFLSKKQGFILIITVTVLAMFSRVFVTTQIHTDLHNITPEHATIDVEEDNNFRDNSIEKDLSYAIMGDMGSSGSRVYVYTYKKSNRHDAEPCSLGAGGEYEGLELMKGFEDIIKDRKSNEKKPGVDSLAKGPLPYNADEYFSSLISFAKKLIPEDKHAQTPFFMYATAGLRTLAEKNEERIFDDDEFDENHGLDQDDDDFGVGVVANLLSAIRDTLSRSPFMFSDSHARILTGEEEALYDWLSLQQMLHNGERTITKENDQILDVGLSHDGAFAMGIIDTGGASSQIAYLPHYSLDGNAKSFVFGEKTRVVARSFLGYGMYHSRSILEESVIKKCIENPHCDQYNSLVNPCFSWNHTHTTYYDGIKYDIQGGGNFDACYKEILEIFDLPDDCDSNVCGIHGVPLPEPKKGTKFLAIDNANRAASFFGYQGPSSLINLQEDVRIFCSTEWNDAMRIYGPRSNEFRIKKYCYEGVYLLALLHNGYKFPMDSDNIVFTDYIGGVHLNWALGAMGNELNIMCKNGALK